jgi:hypothetical protein
MTGLTMRQMTRASGKSLGSNSETNYNQGGGDKKAGLAYQVGRNSWFMPAMNNAGSRNTLYTFNGVFGLRHTRNPNVRFSRPIGSTLTPTPYWSMGNIGA